MTITKEDYLKARGKFDHTKRERKVIKDASSLRQMMQASVALENLTNQPSWDLFLRYLQAAKEAWSSERDRVLRDMVMDGVDLEAVRLTAIRLDERVRLIEVIIGLPSELIQAGQEAKTLAERMEEDGNSSGAIGEDSEDHPGSEAA